MTVQWTVRADPNRARRILTPAIRQYIPVCVVCICMSLSRKVVLVHRPHIPQLILCAVQVAVGFPGAASAAPGKQYQSTHLSFEQLLLSEIQHFFMKRYINSQNKYIYSFKHYW